MPTINWDSRGFRKSSFSGAGNDCVMVHRSLCAIGDSKSGILLGLPTTGLVSLAKSS